MKALMEFALNCIRWKIKLEACPSIVIMAVSKAWHPWLKRPKAWLSFVLFFGTTFWGLSYFIVVSLPILDRILTQPSLCFNGFMVAADQVIQRRRKHWCSKMERHQNGAMVVLGKIEYCQ